MPKQFELEMRAFSAAHDLKIPAHVRDLIQDLWATIVQVEGRLIDATYNQQDIDGGTCE